MKKKLLAMLLVVCMALTLLPAALATPGEPAVRIANPNLSVYESYDKADYSGGAWTLPGAGTEAITATSTAASGSDPEKINVTINVTDLEKHEGGPVDSDGKMQTAYWLGIAIPKEDGLTYKYKQGWGEVPKDGDAEFDTPDGTDEYEEQIWQGFYWALTEQNKSEKGYLQVTATKDETATTILYIVDFSSVTLKSEEVENKISDVQLYVVKDKTSYDAIQSEAWKEANPWDDSRDDITVTADTDLPWLVVFYNRGAAGTVTFTAQRSDTESGSYVNISTIAGNTFTASAANENAYFTLGLTKFTNADGVSTESYLYEDAASTQYGFFKIGVKLGDGEVVYSTAKQIENPNATYTVTAGTPENGTVAPDKTTDVKKGETITLTVTPNEGYVIKTVTYTFETQTVTLSAVGGAYTFVMPGANVTVNAEFEEKPVDNPPPYIPSIPSTPSTPDKTETTTSPDGTTTTTTTKPDGSKEVAVKAPDGTTADVKVDASGKTHAEVSVSAEAANKGSVTLPIPAVPVASSSAAASTVKVSVPAASQGKAMAVTVPTQTAPTGTVAVIVKADGTEQIVKKSVVTEDGLYVPIDGDAELKIVNNTKSFTDTSGHWASEAISFVSGRELYQGMGDGTFAPGGDMNRAMLVTVLHRLEDMPKGGGVSFDDVASGQYYAEAVAWGAGSGIVQGNGTGFDPNGTVTRQQLATFLYRYAKTVGADTTASGSMSGFNDAGKVQSWASDAMSWAIGAGLINGKGAGVLDPEGNTTRAEVATILMRFCQFMAK